ncbi:MAG: helix-turn-helix transcriptional regulator [Clostridia bacterium]|nr:helix-turn-helix transcriptional regulator [Clostridia bacterium]
MENNLKLLRLQKKKTQLMVQMDTGIEQALLSKYENGLRIPPTETLIILADYYNVSIDYILKRTDIPKFDG